MRPRRIGVGATFPVTNPQAYTDALVQLNLLTSASQLQPSAIILAIQTLDADAAQFDASDKTALTSSNDYTQLVNAANVLSDLPSGPIGSSVVAPVLVDVEQHAKRVQSTLTIMLAKAATAQPAKQASLFTPGRIAGAVVGGGIGLLLGGPAGAVVGSIAGIIVDGSITGKST